MHAVRAAVHDVLACVDPPARLLEAAGRAASTPGRLTLALSLSGPSWNAGSCSLATGCRALGQDASAGAVGVAAVLDAMHHHGVRVVIDFVDHAVVASARRPQAFQLA